MADRPLITVAVPSFNQGQYLDQALTSIFQQRIPLEVFVADGGSTDDSLSVIHKWEHKLAGWRSYPDRGQAAAINECVARGAAPFVCWLNSDDWFLAEGLQHLLNAIELNQNVPAVYGRSWNFDQKSSSKKPVWVEEFSEERLAVRCIISQPATLIRRSAWEQLGGLDDSLRMTMDYDLWWRLFKRFGPLEFVDHFVGVNREHAQTKTNTQRRLHYQEAIAIVRTYHGRVPIKWWLAQPYAVWFKALKHKL